MNYCSIEKAAEYANAKITSCFEKHKLAKYMKFPTIVWKNLGIRRAGFATYSINTITLNTSYLQSKDWQKFLDETPLHELAHLVAFNIYHSDGHDYYWKHCCKAFGLAGNRCHDFATPENAKTKTMHTVCCACGEHKVSNTIFKRMLAGQKYRCCKCNGDLKFKKENN